MATTRLALELLAKNRTQSTLSRFRGDIGSTTRTLRRLAGAALAAAGIYGIGYMIKQQMAAIDATAKLSDRLGIATEALVGLQHAAQISGVEAETLNKSLEIFSRRLGEVDMGVGQATYALDKLGLDYKMLIDRSPAEAIGIVADQIASLKTQSEKAAAANYLFGRSGQQLLNLFDQGSKGIAEFQREAERLGLTFSRFDAAKVERANDALTRAKSVMIGLFRSATIEIAPYIDAAATAFANWATEGEGVGIKVTHIFEGVTLSIITAAEETETLIRKLNALANPLDHIAKIEQARQRAYQRTLAESKESYIESPTIGGPFGFKGADVAAYKQILAEERIKIGADMEQSRRSIIREVFSQIRGDAAAAAKTAAGSGMGLQTGRQLLTLSQRRGPSPAMLDARHIESGAGAAGRIGEQAAIGSIRMEAEAARTKALAAQMADFIAGTFQQAFRSIEYTMSSVFVRMRQEGQSFGEAMKGIWTQIGDIALDVIGQIMVRQALIGVLGGQANYNSLMGIDVKGSRAVGGYVPQTGLYQLHAGERVTADGGGAPVVQIINNGAPLQQAGDPIMEGNMIQVMVDNAVMESYDRGGPVRDIYSGRRG